MGRVWWKRFPRKCSQRSVGQVYKFASVDHSIFVTSRQLQWHRTCDPHVGVSHANNMPRRPMPCRGPTMRRTNSSYFGKCFRYSGGCLPAKKTVDETIVSVYGSQSLKEQPWHCNIQRCWWKDWTAIVRDRYDQISNMA